MTNANEVIESFSKHEDDPFDAILILNLSLYKSLNNIIQTIERLKRSLPRLFLIFIGQQNDIDGNINKLLKESSEFLQWTIVICNEINSSISTTKYRVETTSNPTNQQSINATDLLDFLHDELNIKKHLNEILYLY
jgi:hypothetical protein